MSHFVIYREYFASRLSHFLFSCLDLALTFCSRVSPTKKKPDSKLKSPRPLTWNSIRDAWNKGRIVVKFFFFPRARVSHIKHVYLRWEKKEKKKAPSFSPPSTPPSTPVTGQFFDEALYIALLYYVRYINIY